MRSSLGLFLAASVGLVAVPARTLVSQATPGPRQDILNYQLTLPKANQLITAMGAMTKYVVSEPGASTRMIAMMRLTPAERLERFEKDPKAMAICKENGLTAQEYLVGVPALRMALRAAQDGTGPSGSVSAANLAFAKANLAELKPKMDAADGIKP
jgi:hypothetical protein